jgi:sulfate/thiosulfate transport system permease protein
MTAEQVAVRGAARTRRSPNGVRLGMGSGIGLGVAVLWLSVLVLLPMAAVVAKASGDGWGGFVDALTGRQAAAALRLTVFSSLGVAVVNAVMGTLVAWVLVRDRFPGKRVLEAVIDIPFALPTIVAGLVLLSLYGAHSPVGVNWFGTRQGIFVALLFVTLPFVVRTVEPVLLELDTDVEEAAASLGAAPFTTFRRVVLPNIVPAIAAGTALAFARAMGEFGSVILISGGQSNTQVASMFMFQQIENDSLTAAAATATVLLVISFVVLILLDVLQRRAARRG